MNADHLILPITALKPEVSNLFDALADGRVVYVSKRGEVVAAFHPVDRLPLAVAATYAMPQLDPVELTARDIGRSVPSKAVSDAANGLPSLVTKDREVYGVLTEAVAPPLESVPERWTAAARIRAVNDELAGIAEPSLDDIVRARSSERVAAAVRHAEEGGAVAAASAAAAAAALASAVAALAAEEAERAASQLIEDLATEGWPADDVASDLDAWTEAGSKNEGIVNRLFELARGAFEQYRARPQPVSGCNVYATAWFQSHARALVDEAAAAYVVDVHRPVKPINELRQAGYYLTADPVAARTHLMRVMTSSPALHQGAMWQMGDLARLSGHTAEAKVWYGMVLAGDLQEATTLNGTGAVPADGTGSPLVIDNGSSVHVGDFVGPRLENS